MSRSGMDVNPGDDPLLREDQQQVETCRVQAQPSEKGRPRLRGPRLFALERSASGSDQRPGHDDATDGHRGEHGRDAVHQPNHPVVLLRAADEGRFGDQVNGPRREWSDDRIPHPQQPLAMFVLGDDVDLHRMCADRYRLEKTKIQTTSTKCQYRANTSTVVCRSASNHPRAALTCTTKLISSPISRCSPCRPVMTMNSEAYAFSSIVNSSLANS